MQDKSKNLHGSLEENAGNFNNVSRQSKDKKQKDNKSDENNSKSESKKRKTGKKRKKHDVTLTQMISWQEFKESGRRESQSAYILGLLKLHDKPRSRRQLEEESGLRESAMCRVMNDLTYKYKKTYVHHDDEKSEFSNKLVQFYGVIGKEYSCDD